MKKILTALAIILFASMGIAQSTGLIDAGNSTTTDLAASGVFTGTARNLFGAGRDIQSISIFVYANEPSATNGLVAQWSTNGTTWQDSLAWSVDSIVAKRVDIEVAAAYFRIKYTNGTDSVTSLAIQTILHADPSLVSLSRYAIDSLQMQTQWDSLLADIEDIQSNTDLVETKLDSIEVNIEEQNTLVDGLEGYTDGIEASLDSIEVNIEEQNTFVDGIEALNTEIKDSTNKIAGYVDGLEALVTSIKTAVEIIDNFISGSKGLVTEDNSGAIKTAVELIDNAISGNEIQADIVASLPAGSNNIGDMDILSSVHAAGMSSDSTFTLSVTGTATQLPSIATKVVIMTNFTAGEIVYIGSSAGVTTANGQPLWYGDSFEVNPANANQWFAISDGTTVDLRCATGN